MKKHKVFIFLIGILFYNHNLIAQIWPKTYFPNTGLSPQSLIECYDRGYLIVGCYITNEGIPINGSLIKTNRNGDMLWYKRLGENNNRTRVIDVNQTSDGGFIIAGSTGVTDSDGDPFIMKLDVCGEIEWCNIYNIGQERFDAASAILEIPSGYIALIFYGFHLFSDGKTHLYQLDHNGDMVWQQVYGESDSLMIGAEGLDVRVTPYGHYLISGFCYYPDPDTVEPSYLRPLIIKVDSTGNAEWELPWSRINGVSFHGESYRSIMDKEMRIYSCGRHIESSVSPPGDRPTMIKTDWEGNEISYHDMVPDSWQAVFFNINWFQDSTIALDGGWGMHYGDEGQNGVFKVDRDGNFLDSINIQRTVYCFTDATVDGDNKLSLVQAKHDGTRWHTYFWKLNSDLEYDTLYTYPYVYDSLCPHAIASDTIPLDCVIVGLDEPFQNPETGRLRVYPNPARDKIHILIPDQLKTQTKSPVFNLTTVYHQWRSAVIEIYDLFGRKMFSKKVLQADKELEIDVSAWPRGMFVVRLVYNNQTVGSEKIVVE